MSKDQSYAILSDSLSIAIDEVHRFSTDSVLLASFANVKRKHKLLDLCSGCGIVAFSHYRGKGVVPPLVSVAVDIQKEAVDLMNKTLSQNSQIENFTPLLLDLKEIPEKGVGEFHKKYFDLVTCNPPYQTEQSGFIAEHGRGIQRHELACSLEDICKAAAAALNFGGRFCICQKPSRLTDVIVEMKKVNIEPKRIRFVQKNVGSPAWLFLIEGKLGAKSGVVVEAPLIMYDEKGELNQEVKDIYKGGES